MSAHKHMYIEPHKQTHTKKLFHSAKGHSIPTITLCLLAGLKRIKMPGVKSHFFILLLLQTKHLRVDKSFNDHLYSLVQQRSYKPNKFP